MSTVVGQWRATYTPGDWVLLSGPTSTVLLEPPPPERAGMVDALWEEVVASSSMTDLAGRLAGYPLDSLPSFAAFFWTVDGMRSLVRGSVSVIDLASGVTVADGEGIQTWSEVGLGQVSQVLVDVQAGNGARPELPLVVGAVRASSVRLDASEGARVRSPQVPVPPAEAAPADQPAAYAGDGSAEASMTDDDTEEQPETDPPQDGSDANAGWAGLAPVGPAAPVAALPPVPEARAELPGLSTELLADPFADDEDGDRGQSDDSSSTDRQPEEGTPPEWQPEGENPLEWQPEAWTPDQVAPESAPPASETAADVVYTDDPNAEYPMWEPDPDPVPARAWLPDRAEEMENADTQLMPPPYQAATTGTEVSQNSLIMAVVCQYGHASAQNATMCRICGSPIAPQGPQLLPRPIMALLRASDGGTAEVDRAVLIGRAPSAQRSSARTPRLLTVPSPGHDISRTHLEVAPEGWTVVVTDLHSTNGTILVRPGGVDRLPLPAGEAVPVELGSVVELGDGISVLIDFPQ